MKTEGWKIEQLKSITIKMSICAVKKRFIKRLKYYLNTKYTLVLCEFL